MGHNRLLKGARSSSIVFVMSVVMLVLGLLLVAFKSLLGVYSLLIRFQLDNLGLPSVL